MRTQSANAHSAVFGLISWAFGVIFAVLGVLNLFLVHPVPGVFYLLVSLVYLPPMGAVLHRRFGFALPIAVKIVLGLAILWATLAMGELVDRVD
jgi:hypothetical protein